MTPPILYSFRRCPYAIRARFALKYAQITCRLREIQLKNKPVSMLRFSPKGTVPVLVLENKQIIEESLDIIYWALAQNDPDGFSNISSQQKIQVSDLISYNDNYFAQILTQFKYPDKYPDKNFIKTTQEVHEYLLGLENKLNKNKFLITSHPTIGDIALFPFVRQRARIDEPEFRKLSYKKLHSWLDYFYSHEIYKTIMQKFPIWHEGDPEQVF